MSRTAWVPALFVLLWSTGFIGMKLAAPYAEPLTFLSIRFAVVTAILVGAAAVTRAPWPRRPRTIGAIALSGILLQAVYLGGVNIAIWRGISAGVSALIVCLQPILVAIAAAPLLGERVTRRQWLGLGLGLAGVALVVEPKLAGGEGDLWALAANVAALLGITTGALAQKRWCPDLDLRSGSAIQFAASTLVCATGALVLETREVTWAAPLWLALAWLVLVLSLGAVALLYWLIRRGAAAQVASLFFLVPPCTALIAWPLFGETLGPVELAGMALAAIGVWLVNRRARPA